MLERSFHTPLPLTLEVSIPSGDIEVETTDGEESTVVVDGDERLLEEVEIHHEGGRLVVEYRGRKKLGLNIQIGGFGWGSDGIRVHARLPHGAGLKVKTASADTEVDGALRLLELSSASGDVRVRGEIAENATVKTVSGDVALGRVGGNLSVQCVSGDLRAGPVGGSVDTKSVSGDVRLDGVAAGDVHFTSVSGDVEIGVAPGSLLDVDAGSVSGDLGSEVPLGSEPVADEHGDTPTVVLRGRTVSGDVRVFRA